VFVTGVTIRDVKISGKPHKSIALSLKGELPFGVAGALAHPTYVRSPVLPKVAHLHLSLLYSATIDEDTGCAPTKNKYCKKYSNSYPTYKIFNVK